MTEKAICTQSCVESLTYTDSRTHTATPVGLHFTERERVGEVILRLPHGP